MRRNDPMKLRPDLVDVRGLETIGPLTNLYLFVLDRAWKSFFRSNFIHIECPLRVVFFGGILPDAVGETRWAIGLKRDLCRDAHLKSGDPKALILSLRSGRNLCRAAVTHLVSGGWLFASLPATHQ